MKIAKHLHIESYRILEEILALGADVKSKNLRDFYKPFHALVKEKNLVGAFPYNSIENGDRNNPSLESDEELLSCLNDSTDIGIRLASKAIAQNKTIFYCGFNEDEIEIAGNITGATFYFIEDSEEVLRGKLENVLKRLKNQLKGKK